MKNQDNKAKERDAKIRALNEQRLAFISSQVRNPAVRNHYLSALGKGMHIRVWGAK